MSKQANQFETLTGVGPGTPMGNLFRRFWVPAVLSSDVPVRDGTPFRVRILGEDLIAFRDTSGRVGVISAYCAHRRAPLFFGRNEDCGLRCVYHGWKFNVDGECVDIPNIVQPQNIEIVKQARKLTSYPVREAGGIAWTYMGPPDKMPPLPEMEWMAQEPSRVHVSRWLHRSNWLQAMEGEIDSSHAGFLHNVIDPTGDPDRTLISGDLAPEMFLKETPYGYVYGARRSLKDQYYWRVSQWMLPFWSSVPGALGDLVGNGRAWVPIDDQHTTAFAYRYHPDEPLPAPHLAAMEAGILFPPRSERGVFRLPDGYAIDTDLPLANMENDYLIDRELQRSRTFTGIWGVNDQDRAIQERMQSSPGRPGIVDRSAELLVRSDLPIVAARRILTRLVRELEEGREPAVLQAADQYGTRALSQLTPIADFDEFMQAYGDKLRMPQLADQ